MKKKKSFIPLFITTHIALIFLTVYKHTLFVRESYTHQECEKKRAALKQRKESLTQQLYALKDRVAIKNFAQTKLKMKSYKLSHVKTLRDHG